MRRGTIFRHRSKTGLRATLALACVLLAMPQPGAAQSTGSVSDYQLPPGRSSESAAAGPVDSEVPVVRTTGTPQPAEAATPAAGHAPVATRSAKTNDLQRAAPTLSAAPRPRSRAVPPPLAEPATPPQPFETASAPAEPEMSDLPAPSGVDARQRPVEPVPGWWIALAALAAVLVLGGVIYRIRKPASAPAGQLRVPREETREPSAPARPPPPVSREPAPSPTLVGSSIRQASTAPVTLELEANALRRSLVYATLTYRLTITNRSTSPVGPAILFGDLAAAHATLSMEQQLQPGAALPVLHSVPQLTASESRTLTGSVRLPLAEVRPIRQGSAALFVPLVRIRVADAAGAWNVARVFVVGEPGQQRGWLRPLRLDTMPGVTRGLVQREIVLDLAAAAG